MHFLQPSLPSLPKNRHTASRSVFLLQPRAHPRSAPRRGCAEACALRPCCFGGVAVRQQRAGGRTRLRDASTFLSLLFSWPGWRPLRGETPRAAEALLDQQSGLLPRLPSGRAYGWCPAGEERVMLGSASCARLTSSFPTSGPRLCPAFLSQETARHQE